MPTLTLPDLPLETILDITDLLPPRGTICLALTCKKLYNSERLQNIWTRGFNPRENCCGCRHETLKSSVCPPLPLVNHERYLFLQILSRVLPGKQLCDSCQILHQQHEISIPRPWHRAIHLYEACGWTSVRGKPFNFFNMRYQLHFADAQQIMNRFRRKEPTDLLLKRLSIDTDWSPQNLIHTEMDGVTKEADVYIRLMVEAKILKGCLMVHSRQTLGIDSSTLKEPDVEWLYKDLCGSRVLRGGDACI